MPQFSTHLRRCGVMLPALLVAASALAAPATGRGADARTALTLSVSSLTRAGAERVLQRGLQEARMRKARVCLVVLDRAGVLRSATCMDGANGGTFAVAMAKARSAASFRSPTRTFQDGVDNGGIVLLAAAPGLFPIEGGVPIQMHEDAVGAVGVSGSSSDVDGQIARAAATALVSGGTP